MAECYIYTVTQFTAMCTVAPNDTCGCLLLIANLLRSNSCDYYLCQDGNVSAAVRGSVYLSV